MILIVDSSTSHADWVVLDGNNPVLRASTDALNPLVYSRRELSHIARLQLPQEFFRVRLEHVYFYGPGCDCRECQRTIEASLTAQFRTLISVGSIPLGASRAMLLDEPGVVGVLAATSGCCSYDGINVVAASTQYGYLLGEEGSGCHLGRQFVSDCLNKIAPKALIDDFYASYEVNPEQLLTEIYSSTTVSQLLSRYAEFLVKYPEDEYVDRLVTASFNDFFSHILEPLYIPGDKVKFCGRVASSFPDKLQRVAAQRDIEIAEIAPSTIEGLITYHSTPGLT